MKSDPGHNRGVAWFCRRQKACVGSTFVGASLPQAAPVHQSSVERSRNIDSKISEGVTVTLERFLESGHGPFCNFNLHGGLHY